MIDRYSVMRVACVFFPWWALIMVSCFSRGPGGQPYACLSSEASWVSFVPLCPIVTTKLSSFYLKTFVPKLDFFFSVLPEIIDFWWPTVLYTLKIIFSETVCCRLTALVNWHSGCASSHLLWELGSFSICWHSLSENENSIEVHDGIIKCPSKKQEVAVFAVCQCFYAIQAGVAHVCMLNSYYQKQHIFGYMSPNPHTNQHSSIIKLN